MKMANHCGHTVCNTCVDDTPPDTRLMQCSRCHGGAKYCGADCQARDWPIHKIFCGMQPVVPLHAPGSGAPVQALFLPQDSKEPILVSVIQVGNQVDAARYIPGGWSEIKHYSSEQFPQYDDNEMRCGFSLYYGNQQSVTLSENKCIKRILAGHSKAFYGNDTVAEILGNDCWKTMVENAKKWNGPLLVVKSDRYKKNGLLNPTYEDFEVGDVPRLVIYLAFVSKILVSG